MKDSKWRLPDEDRGFEDLCCLIAQKKFNDPNAQKYGRKGQKQDGVDIRCVDYTQKPERRVVIQCKFKESPDSFNLKKVPAEFEDELDQALNSEYDFDHFIYACNLKNDTHLQNFADGLQTKHNKKITLWSIDDLKLVIEADPELAQKYTVSERAIEYHAHHYGERKVEKFLSQTPVKLQFFIGREDELGQIFTALNQSNTLLLVNGEGGIGKTTLASAYYFRYQHEYQHVAWVYADDDIADALMSLEVGLQLPQDKLLDKAQRIQRLQMALLELQPKCLLILDNANSLEALRQHFGLLNGLTNFHILLTSRVAEFAAINRHQVAQLNKAQAKALFCHHYPAHNPTDDEWLFNLFEAVGFNTLVIELLAKNLNQLNRYSQKVTLAELLEMLDSQGLTNLSDTKPVELTYGNIKGEIRLEKPENVIAAMYQTAQLDTNEQKLIAAFSLLPAEPIEYRPLQAFLGVEIELPVDDTLTSLHQQGWIEFNPQQSSFKCSPVVQQVVQSQQDLAEIIEFLMGRVIYLLQPESSAGHLINCNYIDAALYARFAEHLAKFLEASNDTQSIFYQNIARYYQTIGNITKALQYFEGKLEVDKALVQQHPDDASQLYNLSASHQFLGDIYSTIGELAKALKYYEEFKKTLEQLHQDHPQDAYFKNGLAVAYSKLGETYSEKGYLDKALEYFEQYLTLRKQLHQDHPQLTDFKNGLAVAYSKLGEIYSEKGDLDKALEYQLLDTELSEQLHQNHPQHTAFKNGLAIAYEKLGATYSEKEDLDKALDYFTKRKDLGEQLHQDHPQHTAFKNGLAVAYEKLGDTYRVKEDLDKALDYFTKRKDLVEQLHQDHPQHTDFKNGLAVSYYKLAQTFEQQSKPISEVIGYLTKAQKIWCELTNDCPGFVEYQRNLDTVNGVLARLAEK